MYKLPERYKNIVGKQIYKHVYVHTDYIKDILPNYECFLKKLKKHKISLKDYDILKFNKDDLILIKTDNFKLVSEPTLLYQSIITENEVFHKKFNNQIIYHHKWQFVKDDYKGFNMLYNKVRTLAIKEIIDKKNLLRIGIKKIWDNEFKEKIDKRSLEIYLDLNSSKTAIKRNRISKPLQILLERNLIDKHDIILDYGSGQNFDVDYLYKKGYNIFSYDLNCNLKQIKYNKIMCNYVLNTVTENQRRNILNHISELNPSTLFITVRTNLDTRNMIPFLDGFMTQKHTFQKPFNYLEIKSLVDTINYRIVDCVKQKDFMLVICRRK